VGGGCWDRGKKVNKEIKGSGGQKQKQTRENAKIGAWKKKASLQQDAEGDVKRNRKSGKDRVPLFPSL